MPNMTARLLNAAYESEPRPYGLVGYILNREWTGHSPPRQGAMFDYVLARNGLYLQAEREELEVCFQVAQAEVRGLDGVAPLFDFRLPDVPDSLVGRILQISRHYAEDSKESLFWLRHSELNPYDDGWLLEEPAQDRSAASCRPLDGQEDLYGRVVIEVHSHHSMPPRFSPTDDADEVGFRLYGVLGNLPDEPMIRLRVGVYGAGFWEIPASWALDLPRGLMDCNPDFPPEEEEDES